MRPPPPPADDLSSGPVHLDGAQPALEIPTPDGPATIWVRAPRASFGAEADPDFGRLENLLGVPRPWIGDLKNDPVSGLALSRAQRRREPRALPPIQEVPVQVRGLTVTTPGGRPLVEDVSFDVAPGAILAIAGPAQRPTGALVSALAGVAPFSGRISYGATHLTEDSAPLIRGALGIVPRDNLLTGPMPLRRALAHTVALRQPMAPRADRGAAVDEVAQGLGLIAHLDTPLVDLGPAAAKRAAIAMEVLARASVLILDEPTAGLDPEDEAELLRMLQALAQVGRRTIILTTHSAMAMSVADNVLLLDVTRAGSGRLAYHGPAAEAAHHFGADREWDFAHVYAELADPTAEWSTQVRPALAPFDPDAGAAITASRRSWPALVPAVRRLALRRLEEFWWRGEAYLALLAPGTVLVMLALLVLGWGNLDPTYVGANTQTPRLLLGFMTLAIVLPPLVTAARDIVRERRAVVRDVTVGLSPAAYILGRYAALLAAGFVPALLPLVLLIGQGSVGSVTVAGLVALGGAAAATAIGLMISALGRREPRVLWGVAAVLVAQILLCGAFVAIEDSAIQPFAAMTPGYWVFRGLASSQDLAGVDAACRAGEEFCSPHWAAAAGVGRPVLALAVMALIALVAATLWVRQAAREERR